MLLNYYETERRQVPLTVAAALARSTMPSRAGRRCRVRRDGEPDICFARSSPTERSPSKKAEMSTELSRSASCTTSEGRPGSSRVKAIREGELDPRVEVLAVIGALVELAAVDREKHAGLSGRACAPLPWARALGAC